MNEETRSHAIVERGVSEGAFDPTLSSDSPQGRTLQQTLRESLGLADVGSPDLESELSALERTHGATIYSTSIYLLSHLRVAPDEAKRHWRRIMEHRRVMGERLESVVDLRVALLDYFLAVTRKLENPTIVEMRLLEQARNSCYRDELTGLHNFRFFSEHLAREVARCERSKLPLSLGMVDVDDFKFYNDRNGHDAGNRALATVARLMADTLRGEDIVARYGGEEFALVFPAVSKIAASQVAERVRGEIARHLFAAGEHQPGGKLTVSVGIATLPADARNAEELVRQADSALYLAKAHGKNRIRLFGQSSRSHRRVGAALEGTFRFFEQESHPLTTVTVSEGGLLFVSDRHPPEGRPIAINLKLPSTDQDCPVFGRVLYVKQRESGNFEAAVSLNEFAAPTRQRFTKFVREAEERG